MLHVTWCGKLAWNAAHLKREFATGTQRPQSLEVAKTGSGAGVAGPAVVWWSWWRIEFGAAYHRIIT